MEFIEVSVAASLDGYIADRSNERLLLSSAEDFADIDLERSRFDAILVGAGTIRRDNPSLLLKNPEAIAARRRVGRSSHPTRVTITNSGNLDRDARIFSETQRSIVFCAPSQAKSLAKRLGSRAEVIAMDRIDPASIVRTLSAMNIQSLFVEGGSRILTAFLASGMFHQMRLALAPFFVGDATAPRIVNPADFLNHKNNRLSLFDVRALGDTAVLRFENREFARICE